MLNRTKHFLFFFFSLFLIIAQAQKKESLKNNTSLSLKPEALSAKAFLEDLLSRRYGQEMSALVKRENFSLGVQLELTQIERPESKDPDNEPAEEPVSDLMIGQLDPENLLKKFGGTAQQSIMVESFLKDFQIKSVDVTVGVSESLGPEAKADVEKWLTKRLADEFGRVGKSRVLITKIPIEKEKPKEIIPSLWDKLEKFQALAGQLVFALCVLFGIFLWKILSRPLSINTNGDLSTTTSMNSQGENKNTDTKSDGSIHGPSKSNNHVVTSEYRNLKAQLLQVTPQVKMDLEAIIRSWCQMGESGLMRLACFAEVIGQEFGRLPIPVDAMAHVSKVFTQMISMPMEEKNQHLQKAYWDVLAVLNLGSDSLEKPFSYISQTNSGMMKEILVNQNVKMQTLVSLFMTVDQRKDYLKSLPDDKKMELLHVAAGLSEVDSVEFKTMDLNFKNQLKPQTNASKVPLEMTLNKLVESISITEQLRFLPSLDHNLVVEFKQMFPSLAFIHQWPSEALRSLLSKTTADELTAYLTLKPEMQTSFIELCPPFTAELVTDELSSSQTLSPEMIEMKLGLFSKRLVQMVNSRDIILEEIFKKSENENENENKNKNSSSNVA
ncbi:MAG: hypothetical protein H7235_11430 [Bdellovibrionaceae bacterium]|nr:hypothetical protein [Pseudobdellovibrionaceae bacterium]